MADESFLILILLVAFPIILGFASMAWIASGPTRKDEDLNGR